MKLAGIIRPRKRSACAAESSNPLTSKIAAVTISVMMTMSFTPMAAFADDGGEGAKGADGSSARNPDAIQQDIRPASGEDAEASAPAGDSGMESAGASRVPDESDASDASDASDFPMASDASELSSQTQSGASDSPGASSVEGEDGLSGDQARDGDGSVSSENGDDEELSAFGTEKHEQITLLLGDVAYDSAFLTGSGGDSSTDHVWTMPQEGIAYFYGEQSMNYNGVTAQALGEVVVTHTYKEDSREYEDTFTLTVRLPDAKNKITILPDICEKVYDGKPLSAVKVTARSYDGYDVKIEYSGDGGETWIADPSSITATNVSDSRAVCIRASVPGKYEGYAYEDEQLVIYPRYIVLISASDSKVYDGEPLSNSKVTHLKNRWVRGEEPELIFKGSQLEAGTSKNMFFCKFSEGVDRRNYEICYRYGTLTVEPRQVRVIGSGWDEVQDFTGEEYRTTDCSFEGLLEGDAASISYELKGTLAGTYVGVFGDDFEVVSNGEDRTSNYEIAEEVPGALTIAAEDSAPETPDDPDSPISDDPSKDGSGKSGSGGTGKPGDDSTNKTAGFVSKSAKTGDMAPLFTAGVAGVALAFGVLAFAARKRRELEE